MITRSKRLKWKVYYDYGRKHVKFRHKKIALAFASWKNGFIITIDTDRYYRKEYTPTNLENLTIVETANTDEYDWEYAWGVQHSLS